MKVMVVGSGAREHALATRIAGSPQVDEIVCAPGNGGTAAFARSVALTDDSPGSIVEAARAEAADFVVVGPEAPLVAGAIDALQAAGIECFGPTREAAQMEGSKTFSKHFMARHGIPTGAFEVFDDADAAEAYVRSAKHEIVVKADGLAAGKGVVVPESLEEAIAAIDDTMRKRAFGESGSTVVIEERLRGQEVSYHVVCDGEHYVPLAAAQDHKAVNDGDRGPNTGGMGAYSPPPVVTPDVEQRILSEVVEPTMAGFRADGVVFKGALFIGLMIVDGAPKVIEYNVRFGDPETQVLMARYGGDVMELLLSSARGTLAQLQPSWKAPAAMCVVMAAPGYPGSYPKGIALTGLDEVAAMEGIEIIHAGTRREGDGVVSSGGRVLGVTAVGDTIDEVARRAYAGVEAIGFEGAHYRRDIGHWARSDRR